MRALPTVGLVPHVVNLVLLGPQEAASVALEDPASAAFGPGKMELMAKAAQLAYDDSPGLGRIPDALRRQTGFDVHSIRMLENKGRDVQGYLAAGDRMVLCVFRGTEPLSLVDWALDFEVCLVERPLTLGGGRTFRLHEGFWDGVEAVWKEQLLPELERTLTGDRYLYLGGHSLGGALAMITAARLPDECRKRLRGVYTIGQPRVGDYDFSAAYDNDPAVGKCTWRLVNAQDIVPRLPLEVMDYEHAGDEIHCAIGPDVMLRLDWGRRCALKTLNNVAYGFLPDFIQDHFPEAYVRGAMG